LYERWLIEWQSQTCPICKAKTAAWRGLLFDREPPRSPRTDNREPVGEAFLHTDKTECRIFTSDGHEAAGCDIAA
jgi:hypothetical protein